MSIQPSNSGGSGNGGFQHTIDWGALAAHQFSASIDVLARYCAANLDVYTLKAGEAISGQFQLTPRGRQNVEGVLSKLPSYRTFGDILWVGFGSRHVVRSIATTEQGFTCLALCGVLSECYHEDVASEIFHELAKTVGAPPHLTPSILQWKALLRACAGVLAVSDFGTLVEEFMQLNPNYWTVGEYESSGTKATRDTCASPKSVAEALQGMGATSRGKVAAITIIGSNDLGWLAAVAEWLFSLRIVVTDSSDAVHYSNCKEQEPQVTFVFSSLVAENTDGPISKDLQCTGIVYTLQDASSVFKLRSSVQATTGGRLPWDSFFGRFFGSTFKFLMTNETESLGTAIGSAARLLEAIVSAEEGVPREIISNWKAYVPESHGHGFVTHTVTTFPELASLRNTMDEAASVSFQEAKNLYQHQISRLAISCTASGCPICSGKNCTNNVQRFCRVVVVETILALSLTLAETEIMDTLLPRRTGVELLYKRQVQKRRYPPSRFSFPDDYTTAPEPMCKEFSPFAFVYRDSNPTLLELCVEIFTGCRNENVEVRGSCTAISSAGICIYSGILRPGALSGSTDDLFKLQVSVGHIEFNEKPFDRLMDDRREDTFPPERVLKLTEPYSHLSIKVTETATCLEIWFELASLDGKSEPVVLKPSRFLACMARASGWVSCSGTNCAKIIDVPSQATTSFELFGKKVHLIRGDPITRCAAMALLSEPSATHKVVLRGNGCLQCCFRAAISGVTAQDYFQATHQMPNREDRWIIVSY